MGLQVIVGAFMSGTGASGTTVGITGVGFKPQIVILFGGGPRTTDSTGGDASDAEFWNGAIDSAGNQFVQTNGFKDATANTVSRFYDDRCIAFIDADDASLDGAMGFSSMDNDGFTLRVLRAFTATKVTAYLAISGLTNGKVGTFTTPVAAGVSAVSGVGFTPDSLILIGGRCPTLASATNGGSLSIGVIGSDGGQGCAEFSRVDAGDTAQSVLSLKALSVGNGTSAGVNVASWSAWSSDGFSLNWTTASGQADYIGYIAMQGADFERVDYTSPADTSTTSVVIKKTPVAVIGTHVTVTSGVSQQIGYGFATLSAARGLYWRTSSGDTTTSYNITGFLVSARTPSGSYGLRFNANVVAWDADSADIDVLTNADSYALPAYLFFMSEKPVTGKMFQFVPVLEMQP